jgi:uncharacterized protein (DUF362 family)
LTHVGFLNDNSPLWLLAPVIKMNSFAVNRLTSLEEKMSNEKKIISRRELLRMLALAGGGAYLAACGGQGTVQAPGAVQPAPGKSTTAQPAPGETSPGKNPPADMPSAGQVHLAVARGADPAAITEAALKALGGIERFVKQGSDVIVKPNICTDYYPYEYGATTNPTVVATLVRLALGAGAKRVRVMDFPFGGKAESAYVKSGIEEAVKAAGGEMEIMNPNKYKTTQIPQGKAMKDWKIYQEVLTCDILIDVGIAKHHSLARMTGAMKNLLGVVQNRGGVHSIMTDGLGDLLSVIKPGLTVVDAVRTLMRNGPSGGNLDDVQLNNTVIASQDMVAADAYATSFFGLAGKDIGYIRSAAGRGLGTMDLNSVKVEEISL